MRLSLAGGRVGPRALRGVEVPERGTEDVRCCRLFSFALS